MTFSTGHVPVFVTSRSTYAPHIPSVPLRRVNSRRMGPVCGGTGATPSASISTSGAAAAAVVVVAAGAESVAAREASSWMPLTPAG